MSGRANVRTDALGRALRRAAERECERHAPGLRDAVLAQIATPELARSTPRKEWRAAASLAALFVVGALAFSAWRAARGELARPAARDELAWRAACGELDQRAERGTGRDPELAVPRVAPLHEALVAQAAPRVPDAERGVPRGRDFLARTLPESRALDAALRGELAGLGRDTLAGARFVLERARLGPPARGS